MNKVKFPSAMPSTVFSFHNALGFAENGVATSFICRTPPEGDPVSPWEYFGIPQDERLSIVQLSAALGKLRSNDVFYARALKYVRGLDGPMSRTAVVTRDPGFLPYLVILRRWFGCRVFYQSHNFYLSTRGRGEMNRVHRRRFMLNERYCLNRLHGVMALQTPHACLYRARLSVRVGVCWPGLHRLGPVRDRVHSWRTVAYVGSFQPMKGVETAVKVFSRAARPGWRLRLLGGRNQMEIDYARGLVSSAGLEDRADITGWLPYGSLKEELEKVSIGLLLLEDNFYNRFLTAPSKLFDYMANGIPTVASALPSLTDFITSGKEGLLCQPGDIEAAAAALGALMEKPELIEAMSAAAVQRAGDLLWRDRAGVMLEFMEDIDA